MSITPYSRLRIFHVDLLDLKCMEVWYLQPIAKNKMEYSHLILLAALLDGSYSNSVLPHWKFCQKVNIVS